MKTKMKFYLTADEVSGILGISKGHSYKMIRKMNTELKQQGYLVVAGKIPIRYFEKRCYCYGEVREGNDGG